MDPLKPWPVTPYSFSILGGWLQGYGGSSQVELCSYQQILENRVRQWDLVAPDSGKTVGGWWLGVHRLLFHRSVAPKNFLGYVLHIWAYYVIIYCFFTWTIFTKNTYQPLRMGIAPWHRSPPSVALCYSRWDQNYICLATWCCLTFL